MDILSTISTAFGTLSFIQKWLARREKISINIKFSYTVNFNKRKVTLYLPCEFRRIGGDEIRYIKRILIKPDKEKYSKLQQYFNMPNNGTIEIDKQTELPRNKIVPLYKPELAEYPEYPAVSEIKESQFGAIKEIASNLSQKTHKVGLVWVGSDKISWITISIEVQGTWVG